MAILSYFPKLEITKLRVWEQATAIHLFWLINIELPYFTFEGGRNLRIEVTPFFMGTN